MTGFTWPNFIDLIIVSIFLIDCYKAFGRGLLTELLSLVGAVTVTSFAMNWWRPTAQRLAPYLWTDAQMATFLVFLGMVLFGLLVVHFIVQKLSDVFKWERLHWGIQGLAMVFGALRGLWWAGLMVVILTASGFDYLKKSVMDESILGPHLQALAEQHIAQMADLFPGAGHRGTALVPPMRAGAR